ncbi:hypothetical protein GGI43DRAFT_250816 [Trichoderma evansii]
MTMANFFGLLLLFVWQCEHTLSIHDEICSYFKRSSTAATNNVLFQIVYTITQWKVGMVKRNHESLPGRTFNSNIYLH